MTAKLPINPIPPVTRLLPNLCAVRFVMSSRKAEFICNIHQIGNPSFLPNPLFIRHVR
jgi:hypothetical protein